MVSASLSVEAQAYRGLRCAFEFGHPPSSAIVSYRNEPLSGRTFPKASRPWKAPMKPLRPMMSARWLVEQDERRNSLVHGHDRSSSPALTVPHSGHETWRSESSAWRDAPRKQNVDRRWRGGQAQAASSACRRHQKLPRAIVDTSNAFHHRRGRASTPSTQRFLQFLSSSNPHSTASVYS